jgi:hypothetical protein
MCVCVCVCLSVCDTSCHSTASQWYDAWTPYGSLWCGLTRLCFVVGDPTFMLPVVCLLMLSMCGVVVFRAVTCVCGQMQCPLPDDWRHGDPFNGLAYNVLVCSCPHPHLATHLCVHCIDPKTGLGMLQCDATSCTRQSHSVREISALSSRVQYFCKKCWPPTSFFPLAPHEVVLWNVLIKMLYVVCSFTRVCISRSTLCVDVFVVANFCICTLLATRALFPADGEALCKLQRSAAARQSACRLSLLCLFNV